MIRLLFFLAILEISFQLGVRVALPHALHGYNKLRLSVIDQNATNTYDGFFSYNSQFKYRWTNMSLHSVLKDVNPGTNTFTIGTTKVEVALPQKGVGVSGVVFGDPCAWFTNVDKKSQRIVDDDSRVANLACAGDVGQNLPPVLNLVASHIDYWTILGDNFYDRYGGMTEVFFDQLDQDIKQRPLITVPGNHDYWLWGDPKAGITEDSFGNGFMQYYAQDTLAGAANTVNFLNFSIPPTGKKLADWTNFASYKQIGDVGFIGYSCAYDWDVQAAFFTEACNYFEANPPTWLFLIGHWNAENLGAAANMDVPDVYKKLTSFKGCGTNKNFKQMYGHTHCNKKMSDHEFMIGNTGYPTNCGEQGFVYITTKLITNTMIMTKFDIAADSSAKLQKCIKEMGSIDNCMHLGTVWLNATST